MDIAKRNDELVLIGIDCSTSPRKVGLAMGQLRGGELSIDAIAPTMGKLAEIEATIQGWLGPRTLLAIDAPLGWPATMADALHSHVAGALLGSIETASNLMFRRETDRVIQARLGQTPLDVGADRIARTAHSALAMLDRLRSATERPIELAWRPGDVPESSAIEVYPAATLRARGWPYRGYKCREAKCRAVRETIYARLAGELSICAAAKGPMLESDHVLDAGLCVLAGADFARGRGIRPENEALARREGWIWVRPPEQATAGG